MTDEELMMLISEASDDQMRDLVTGILYGGVKVAVENGIPAGRAMRDVMALYFQESLGSQVWKVLNVNQRTAERWRHEIRVMMQAAPELQDDGVPDHVVESFQELRLRKIAKDQRQAERMGA